MIAIIYEDLFTYRTTRLPPHPLCDQASHQFLHESTSLTKKQNGLVDIISETVLLLHTQSNLYYDIFLCLVERRPSLVNLCSGLLTRIPVFDLQQRHVLIQFVVCLIYSFQVMFGNETKPFRRLFADYFPFLIEF